MTHEPDGAMALAGAFPIHELPDLGIDVEHRQDGDDTTIAGLVLAHLGHIPTKPGEVVAIDRHTAEVTEVTGHAVRSGSALPTQPDGQRTDGV